ncbi:uncharacterized protein ACA1_231140 [Acanthamoeba castellanii str. Neff]|uniref:Uncharacterized protein n=1 Tax=Acanthamoeba castellanii (strain ATCC 30010 / Neff) TaxID=1257118 RepID=L8H8Y0_ACACF|nr:uncharacterized protein ACA1_231140 [Acanthamoeba castellanii str. Neff]ELR21677.1 hypothetical protein ACA1_231140 [Acanthamoeba castellanii str. Neff]
MVALLNLLANENSPWQLLRLISESIPNIHSKSASGVQHNGLYTIFIGQVNKSYTFNPTIGHVFYQLVLTAYTSSTKAQSILNYTPLHATPLHANFSYHINGASAQPNESKTNIITSAIVIHGCACGSCCGHC